MLRSTRPLWATSSRALASQTAASSRHFSLRATNSLPKTVARIPRPTPASRILPAAQKAWYAKNTWGSGPDPAEEKKFAQQRLEAHPESVSTESSRRHLLEPDEQQGEKPVAHGVKDDLETVKDTFALSSVPKESYVLGLAGTLPYLATSASTVYLSWVTNLDHETQSAFVIGHDQAKYWLSVLEPIQLGYGAIIISFLGAIHWGLEYAEKSPSLQRTRFRYGLGLAAPVVAWPTLFMSWQWALTAQFGAFVGLYFADARASTIGWAPSWYGSYRFVLTAIVGVALMISLIGRAKVGDAASELSGLSERIHQKQGEEPYDEKWAEREQKDVKKAKEAEEKKKREEAEKAKKEKKEGKGEKKEGGDDKKEGGDDKKEGGDDKKEGESEKK